MSLNNKIKEKAYWVLILVICMWVVLIVNRLTANHLFHWGIRPRTLEGLVGIVFAPFLHAGIVHLATNSIPFVVLAGLVILHGTRQFIQVTLFIIVVGGAAVWLFGREVYHIGSSGLIFGYLGYLVGRGWYNHQLASLAVATIVVLLYGSTVWGVLPIIPGVSWESHLFGLVAGVIAARLEAGT